MSEGTVTVESVRTRRSLHAVPDLMAKLREAEIRLRLREAREHAGLSREKLADILTVHRKSIENYEKQRVPWSLLNAWAAATGTSVEYLIHGETGSSNGVSDDKRLDKMIALLGEIRDALVSRPGLTPQQREALALLAGLVEEAPKQSPASGRSRKAGPASPR